MNALTLFQLNQKVREVVEEMLYEPLWIQAELSSVSTRNMHCFIELVQKSPEGNTFIAKARGQIWSNKWAFIRPYFERTTGQALSAGMQVMVKVEVNFHEVYGYSLNVVDINPTFTLGDIARRRQEILQQLEEEGIINLNKELELPSLVQHIAVISSATAAGWDDFQNQLLHNNYGLAYEIQLFPAVMQGEQVESSIIRALNQIALESDRWDIVVIIRGGGATSDLTGFDTLNLAENVAQFPLPIITGIGHERDDTVIDLISHTRVKTPTAAAEFIIHLGVVQLEQLDTLITTLSNSTQNLLHIQRLRLERLTSRIPSLWELFKSHQLHKIETHLTQLKNDIYTQLDRQHHHLELMIAQLKAANPEHIFRLGYSIVRLNGHAVQDIQELHNDDLIEITMENGTVNAKIQKTEI